MDDLHRRLLDLDDLRLAEMDRHGIALAILSLNAPGVQAIPDRDAAVATARRANDRLADAVRARPDRFAGFAALPMQNPEAAAAELTRSVVQLGFKGALVNGFSRWAPGHAVYYDDPGKIRSRRRRMLNVRSICIRAIRCRLANRSTTATRGCSVPCGRLAPKLPHTRCA